MSISFPASRPSRTCRWDRYPEYRPSEIPGVEQVPTHWNVKRGVTEFLCKFATLCLCKCPEPYSRISACFAQQSPNRSPKCSCSLCQRTRFRKAIGGPCYTTALKLRSGSPHQSPGNAAPDETIAVTIDRFAPAKSRRQVG